MDIPLEGELTHHSQRSHGEVEKKQDGVDTTIFATATTTTTATTDITTAPLVARDTGQIRRTGTDRDADREEARDTSRRVVLPEHVTDTTHQMYLCTKETDSLVSFIDVNFTEPAFQLTHMYAAASSLTDANSSTATKRTRSPDSDDSRKPCPPQRRKKAKQTGSTTTERSTIPAGRVNNNNTTASSGVHGITTSASRHNSSSSNNDSMQEGTTSTRTRGGGGGDQPTRVNGHIWKLRGLPYESTDEDVREFLRSVEGVTSINIPRNADNRAFGLAFVQIHSEAGLEQLKQLHQSMLGSRYIEVLPSSTRERKRQLRAARCRQRQQEAQHAAVTPQRQNPGYYAAEHARYHTPSSAYLGEADAERALAPPPYTPPRIYYSPPPPHHHQHALHPSQEQQQHERPILSPTWSAVPAAAHLIQPPYASPPQISMETSFSMSPHIHEQGSYRAQLGKIHECPPHDESARTYGVHTASPASSTLTPLNITHAAHHTPTPHSSIAPSRLMLTPHYQPIPLEPALLAPHQPILGSISPSFYPYEAAATAATTSNQPALVAARIPFYPQVVVGNPLGVAVPSLHPSITQRGDLGVYHHTAQQQQQQQRQRRVVRLRGLPYTVTSDDIRNFLHDVDIAPHGIHNVHNEEGRFIGEAFVEVMSAQDASKAVQHSTQYIKNRYIEVFSSSYQDLRQRVFL